MSSITQQTVHVTQQNSSADNDNVTVTRTISPGFQELQDRGGETPPPKSKKTMNQTSKAVLPNNSRVAVLPAWQRRPRNPLEEDTSSDDDGGGAGGKMGFAAMREDANSRG